jgi:hypothetical protein
MRLQSLGGVNGDSNPVNERAPFIDPYPVTGMTNTDFFIRLTHALGDYDEALVLGTLVALGASEQALRSSGRKIADRYLAKALNLQQVQRATARLVNRGLLAVRVYPKTYTEYTVQVDALRALLAKPLPNARFLPGVSQEPIAFLARLEAESALDAASAAAATHHLSPTEDTP